MNKYVLHPDAYADLDHIWEFIAEDDINAADRFVAAIHKAIQDLAGSPNKGHRRADLTPLPLRFWSVGKYFIAYAPDRNPLVVIAILHWRRNRQTLAALLQGRS